MLHKDIYITYIFNALHASTDAHKTCFVHRQFLFACSLLYPLFNVTTAKSHLLPHTEIR
jgi:hypothetical protein